MFFILDDEHIHTAECIYVDVFKKNSRIVLMILVKSSVGKQGRKCLPFMLSLWSPPPFPRLLHRHRKKKTKKTRTHATHTYTHARTHVHKSSKMPNSQHPRDDLQTVVSKQTNPNLQQWQNWCRCINRFEFTLDVVSGHFSSRVPFCVFYVWYKLCLQV